MSIISKSVCVSGLGVRRGWWGGVPRNLCIAQGRQTSLCLPIWTGNGSVAGGREVSRGHRPGLFVLSESWQNLQEGSGLEDGAGVGGEWRPHQAGPSPECQECPRESTPGGCHGNLRVQ